PVEITVYEDRSFTFITKTPPAAVLIKQALGLEKGSSVPHTQKVGTISRAKIREIAELKLPDLNANDLDAAERIIAGTARSMGVTITDSVSAFISVGGAWRSAWTTGRFLNGSQRKVVRRQGQAGRARQAVQPRGGFGAGQADRPGQV